MTAQTDDTNTGTNKRSAGDHRNKAQREADLVMIGSLYLQGFRQVDIAKQVGISQPVVSRELSRLYARWRESTIIDFNAAKQRELERIDELERNYWVAWRDSREESKRVRKQAMDIGGVKSIRGEEFSEVRSGNPDYLKGVQWCIEQRCKILGINAPTKHEVMLDWREEARKHGIQDPDAVLQRAISAAVAGPDDAGGDPGDSEDQSGKGEAPPENG